MKYSCRFHKNLAKNAKIMFIFAIILSRGFPGSFFICAYTPKDVQNTQGKRENFVYFANCIYTPKGVYLYHQETKGDHKS